MPTFSYMAIHFCTVAFGALRPRTNALVLAFSTIMPNAEGDIPEGINHCNVATM
jgi:hypothetical protein